jgi:hypothetical protein
LEGQSILLRACKTSKPRRVTAFKILTCASARGLGSNSAANKPFRFRGVRPHSLVRHVARCSGRPSPMVSWSARWVVWRSARDQLWWCSQVRVASIRPPSRGDPCEPSKRADLAGVAKVYDELLLCACWRSPNILCAGSCAWDFRGRCWVAGSQERRPLWDRFRAFGGGIHTRVCNA